MTRIVDVAARAGVSPSVVSRLLNGDPTLRIREHTRARILSAAEEARYVPNHAARALRRTQAGALAVALHGVHNPVYSDILAGAEAEARTTGRVLMIADVASLASDDAGLSTLLHSGAVDGVMLQRDRSRSDTIVSRAVSAAVPLVLLNERVRAPLSGVAVDDRAGAIVATRHLINLGHTRIAHLRAPGRNSRARDRESGWAAALAEAGLPATTDMVGPGGATPESGAAGLRQLFERRIEFSAVFAGGMLAAVGALNEAFKHNRPVPEALSIVGFHDSPLAGYLRPALTVVKMPTRELGEHAVRLLTRQIEGAAGGQEVITAPPPVVIPRESTAAI